jgi:hypothetical protein
MRSVDWRTNNDTYRSGGMCYSTIRVVSFLLYDNLSADRKDQRFRHDAFDSVFLFEMLMACSGIGKVLKRWARSPQL